METLRQDIWFGLRMLRKSPAHTLVVVLSLALGIGANAAVFSLVNALLLRRLPVHDPERLVQLVRNTPTLTGQEITFSYPQFERFRATGALEGMFAVGGARFNASAGGDPELLNGQMVTGGYFGALGVAPAAGRLLLPDDDLAGAAPVAVISHAYWVRRFASDPAAVGRSLVLNGTEFAIVGVTAPEFFGLSPGYSPELWIALHQQPRVTPGRSWIDNHWAMRLAVLGRVAPGGSRRQAQAVMAVVYEQIKAELLKDAPAEDRKVIVQSSFELIPAGTGYSGLRRWISKSLLVLMAVVAVVLLIACANVAGLVLARGAARQKELAVRVALGAARRRLIRQLFTESVMLALAGGAAGLALGALTRWLLLRWISGGPFHMLLSLRGDASVLVFTAVVSIVTGIVFGLAPALSVTRFDLNTTLKQSGARGATGRLGLGKVLVVAQVALSLVLLLGANLLVRSLVNLQRVELGFDPERLLVLYVDPGLAGYRGEALTRFNEELRLQLATLPGVRSVGGSRVVPADGLSWPEAVGVDGQAPGSDDNAVIMRDWISPGYFQTMGVAVLLGREFAERDNPQAARAAIINEAMARRFFPGRNPLGRTLQLRRSPGANLEIVGVVRDTRYDTVWKPPPPIVYTPYLQSDPMVISFEIRTAGEPGAVTGAVRAKVREVGKNVPITALTDMPSSIGTSLAQARLMASMLGFFSLLGLLLVSIGLYALMAQAVTRRTREIGVRMALGATRGSILAMVLEEALLLVGVGLAVSLPLAWSARGLVRAYLFQLKFHDPLALLLTAALLLLVAFVAVSVPALRACRVDPTVALRCE